MFDKQKGNDDERLVHDGVDRRPAGRAGVGARSSGARLRGISVSVWIRLRRQRAPDLLIQRFNPAILFGTEGERPVCVGEGFCRYADTQRVSVAIACRPAVLPGASDRYDRFLCPDATTCANQGGQDGMYPVKVLEMFDDNLQVLEPGDETDDMRRREGPGRLITRFPDPRFPDPRP